MEMHRQTKHPETTVSMALQMLFQFGLDAHTQFALARTCKQLLSAAQAHLADLAHAHEPFAVSCQDPAFTLRSPGALQYCAAPEKRLVVQDTKGCSCQQLCDEASFCPCIQGPDECGPACDCLPECCNRERQQGLTIPVTLRLGEKGWAAYAGANLAAGQFVCLYVGDQLTSRAADARLAAYDAIPGGANHALLVVREHLHTGSCLRLNIDATHRGNVARFFNHACDGGVLNVEVSRQRGDLVPSAALKARSAIANGTELTFAYGSPSATGTQKCHCKTPSCLGWLPDSIPCNVRGRLAASDPS